MSLSIFFGLSGRMYVIDMGHGSKCTLNIAYGYVRSMRFYSKIDRFTPKIPNFGLRRHLISDPSHVHVWYAPTHMGAQDQTDSST